MKLFSVEEANDMLPLLSLQLAKLTALYAAVGQQTGNAIAAAEASNAGGGMVGGELYVERLYKIGKLMTEIDGMGVQIKDPSTGLIDFPSLRDNRIVLLCWRLGEEMTLEFWHEIDGGFGGRQKI